MKLYLMKISGHGEEFYKVGKSFNPEERARQIRKHYPEVEILWVNTKAIWHNKDINRFELFFHKDLKHRKYTPDRYFGGSSECYTFLTPAFMRYYIRNNWHLLKEIIPENEVKYRDRYAL